eukprot:CAMPEP_0179142056 /NCGR_PEP_ID=MMETSP0796-20121207/68194_1 /TAXON_ID=73915 /ORGANISM="Pyrodinium bahamense, Strain pbaha01" /LENGTH=37 /DNA_ID= /DNA_START= /DNA_END= /DNA_ORIENTATION=
MPKRATWRKGALVTGSTHLRPVLSSNDGPLINASWAP